MSSSLYKAAVDGMYSLYSMANYDDVKDYLPTKIRPGAFGFHSHQPPDAAKPHSQVSCVFGKGARETDRRSAADVGESVNWILGESVRPIMPCVDDLNRYCLSYTGALRGGFPVK